MDRKPRIGIALGSGGARGWCHIGVLKGLARLGVKPQIVAGTSMGALVGAAYAAGRLDALEDWARALTLARFVRLVDISPSSGGLVRGDEIANVLTELGIELPIERLDLPFGAVATEMETGREVWLREGPATAAVRASVAIPGLIAPARVDGRWMLDGGLTNPVPVSLARAMGADVVIAVNPDARLDGRYWRPEDRGSRALDRLWQALPDPVRQGVSGFFQNQGMPPDQPPHYLDVVEAAIEMMKDHIRRARLVGEPPHLLLNAQFSDIGMLDFHRAADAIAEGEAIVEDHAKAVRRVCGLA